MFYSDKKFYDFKDVLILPKSSEINSRSEINIQKKISFTNNNWEGVFKDYQQV